MSQKKKDLREDYFSARSPENSVDNNAFERFILNIWFAVVEFQ